MFNLNLIRDASTYFEVLNLLGPSMLLNLVNLADLDLPVLNLDLRPLTKFSFENLYRELQYITFQLGFPI